MMNLAMPISIADGDRSHAGAVKRIAKRAGLRNEVIHVQDGREALDFLFRRGRYVNCNQRQPLVVLLDADLKGASGADVLRQLRGNSDVANVPAIAMTSDGGREVNRSICSGPCACIRKPVQYRAFCDAAQGLGLILRTTMVPAERPAVGVWSGPAVAILGDH